MRYRIYEEGDFDALYAVEEICFAPPFRFGRAAMRRIVEEPKTATWIAEDEEGMAGFAVVEWFRTRAGMSAYIQTIEVLTQKRGQGAGQALLELMERSAREAGAQAIGLHVDAENAGAIRLYERQSYACDGRREGYYPQGGAALIYAKRLDG
ncbi:MAG TPA: N-acetyltransferase [Terracidiphilus sp.]|nr:N-acetyltransferase [Terracidiphilus sp.]